MEFADLQAGLGDASPMTVHRYLRQVRYRCSYDHKGRYYTLHDPSRYDRFGLYSHGDIHFSVDGSLKKTVRRMVHEAEAGATHKELQARLRVRVHNTLLELVRAGEVDREHLVGVYLYVHIDAAVREAQLRRRQDRVRMDSGPGVDLALEVVIAVLLVLLHHPGSRPQDVVRRLRGHEPPIRLPHVQTIFDRYDLGEKRGSAIF
ncbi:hypothetical protein KKG45_05410 [bacterium]|nr:hypothetical protein [bacterium]MBU1676158.1 hypothetical protein [bacterium]